MHFYPSLSVLQLKNTKLVSTMSIVSVDTLFLLLLVCLINGCGFIVFGRGCMEEERAALIEIKESINYPEGTAFPTWYGQDCCQWEGVECNVSTSRIVKILIRDKRVRGLSENWYPNATLFAQFKDLQELHLPGNQIGGFISPNALHKLKNLQKLDLRRNSIEDGSSLCWGKMSSLYYLDLSNNKLQGHIPNCLCESHSFTHLDLSHNQFNGTFPSFLFRNLTSIEFLAASHNLFDGVISFSMFANLSKLRYLDISNNDHLEVETEFPTWSPSFQLDGLFLSGCNLNNHSGNKIPSFISTQHHLQSLDLSDNSLVGSIPSWLLYNVSTSSLWLRGNMLSGLFPQPCQNKSSQLALLDISNNLFHGPIPANINLILPMLNWLNVSMNSFEGRIPVSFGEVLKQLRYLDLSRNQLGGEIPYSIASNTTSLEYLNLSDNNLQGEVLPRNSSTPNLRWLYLHRNSFTGKFPDSLSKFSSLQILSVRHNNLSGELSTQLPVLPFLRALLLAGNHFEGRIPLQLCQMKHLHLLDLSNNNLSGDIPSCLHNITPWTEGFYDSFEAYTWTAVDRLSRYEGDILGYMTGIDMSCNQLTGTIPVEMGELSQIQSLNLSSNLLTGQIPVSFENFTQIESLDLSHNRLFGALPPELTNMISLQVFDVSFNNLSGSVPQGIQFAQSDEASYIGNPGLCGAPLTKKCIEVAEEPSYFYSNAATTYTWAFWCFIFLLYSVLKLMVDIIQIQG